MDFLKLGIGILEGLLATLLIFLVLSCGCMQEPGNGPDDILQRNALDCKGNESEIELVQIALRDEEVADAIRNHSFETEIYVSNLRTGENDPEELLTVRFWLFNGTSRPYGTYDGMYSVFINDSKQIVQRSWQAPPRYPSSIPVDMRMNLTNRSICTYHHL
ncbi:hypothetical protein JCM10550A_15320 [Methanogenium cariaci]|jgi:hypothetical protein